MGLLWPLVGTFAALRQSAEAGVASRLAPARGVRRPVLHSVLQPVHMRRGRRPAQSMDTSSQFNDGKRS